MNHSTSIDTLTWGIRRCHESGALDHIKPEFGARTHGRSVGEIEEIIASVRKEAADREALRSPIEAEGD